MAMIDKECEIYLSGFVDGLKPFAWRRDGTEYVGGPGITLAYAVDCVTNEGYRNMPNDVRAYLQAKKS